MSRIEQSPPAASTRASRDARRRRAAAFTLVEVLAALLFMAIIIPVTMEGVSIASRAGMLGQRKAAASRIAERVLDELIVTGGTNQSTDSGTITDGDTTFAWTSDSQPWSEDAMTQLTVRVTFTVQGSEYDVSASTLYDPAAASTFTTG